MTHRDDDAAPASPLVDLDAYVALPRVSGLHLSPDGTRLVAVVSAPDPDGTRIRPALWEIDPAGARPARRLTAGPTGEHDPRFTPAGDLLFVAARPDPLGATGSGGTGPDDPPGALWRLPATGGEAELVGSRPGGVEAPAVAATDGTVVCLSPTLPGAVTADDDAARRAARRERRVTAILHTGHPVRHWDHDLGPDAPRLLAAEAGSGLWRDLTPDAGSALRGAVPDLTPDGTTAVTSWQVPGAHGEQRLTLVAVDTATGARRTLLDDPHADLRGPVPGPDGRTVAVLRETHADPVQPPRVEVLLVFLDGTPPRLVAPDWDRVPSQLAWTPDGAALLVTADDGGRAPLHRIDLATGGVTRLTGDAGAYTDPRPAPDGRTVFALRSAVDRPPTPVRLDTATPDQVPVPLPGPAPAPELPGTLTELTTTAADGTPLRAWLVLPAAEGPAPLLLWIHGGPLGSWNAWQWRWNPWLMAARGYAVLLPDPALSTGYGRDFVARGWGAWGAAPYTDLMALTDAACAHPAIDATRTAAMGGSFGGYMANWIAGHTDRFAAIVTHASLWALDQFGPTTDSPGYWRRELTAEAAAAHSPHHHADAVRTPMLVIHGDRDHRVPIGEALRLWWDLQSRQPDPAASPHRFLYFPDENHWVLAPHHTVLWYRTVLAFLDRHLLGHDEEVPDLLR